MLRVSLKDMVQTDHFYNTLDLLNFTPTISFPGVRPGLQSVIVAQWLLPVLVNTKET